MIVRQTAARHGRRPYPRDRARMLVLGGGRRLVYLPSARAAEIMSAWSGGAAISWEVDDYSGKPHSIHFMPASDGNGGYKLKLNGGRPWIGIPTTAVGAAVPEPAKEAEEIDVLPSIVSVKLPFEFQVTDARSPS
jgi:hypothetical protein